jgi:CheY-like chemotaxis protein
VPIVFVTGDAYAEQVRRAEASGADAVLVKPCLPETLFGEMRRLLALSTDLRERARATRVRAAEQMDRSDRLLDRSRRITRRQTLSRAHSRHDTMEPPAEPPPLVCPNCDQPLRYERSHIGGVNARNAEQWDYYECAAGCGTFQYRQRTRKLRRVS